ncbi:MAG: polymerase I protein [Microgenomates group bacterium GW2011_GWF2_45_18]|nr:MAG: polymerase I protein [Microgenomates group bacterium GW2011_GWF1_44_10]KKU02154.1 MAG: polymerase I protein [Microgenomates group bacterium GW2011_GWF2_45_18]OGJ41594.1 MAG: hypothetical protein A2378_04075 [Candidatus Pacebacteria bacterium RIFOXYB1_FULL_44_10]HAU98704.1 hypothetical protein [Candidatus Paceibacterota bacterium]HAX01870.1 hypothetical protein [Candidatus Paceibacterota bacterium]
MLSNKDIFVVVDGHAVVYRAYHAFPPLTTPEGELVNAVYGFSRILLKVIKDLHPEYIAVAFDMGKPTFRHASFAGYKAQRKETPTDLISQLGRVREVVETLNIPIFGVEGYEADDVIGTISEKIAQNEQYNTVRTIILTGDRDAYQLIRDEKTTVYMPAHHREEAREYSSADVEERMGIGPHEIVDYKALAGDASDNIPGVKGVGEKTATSLIKAFGTVDEIYKKLTAPTSLTAEQKKVLTPRLVKLLSEDYEAAKLSQQLATIDCAVPLQFDLEACRVSGYEKDKAVSMFEKLGFRTLLPLLPLDAFELGVQEALFV